ncbi:hypothetical protein AVEN_56966-1, partial [Araneus ventricosus]
AELTAIDFAVCSALESGVRINIYTDSQSSIKALRSARSRSATVNKVKKILYLVEGPVGLTCVKAHAGDPGMNSLITMRNWQLLKARNWKSQPHILV